MRTKFLAAVFTAVMLIALAGLASAEEVMVVSEPVYDIQPSTTYTFTFDNLPPTAMFEDGVLFISETNADFNMEYETVAVTIDGVFFGAPHFATDDGDIRRSLMTSQQLSFTDMFYITDDGQATIELTTSGFMTDVPYEDSMYVWLVYEGDGSGGGDPADCVADLIDFFEAGVEAGTIYGEGPGNSGQGRLKAFGNKLYKAYDSCMAEEYDTVCGELASAEQKCDGMSPPPDFIGGEDVPALHDMIMEALNSSDCYSQGPEKDLLENSGLPDQAPARLVSAQPNPFNPRTAIAFELDREGHCELALYDLQGRMVRTLISESRAAGMGLVEWDGLDEHGARAATGVYLVRLQAAGTEDQFKVTLVK